MDNYQEYKQEFLDSLRADSAINGSDTQDEFLSCTLGMLEDFDEVQSPQKVGFGDNFTGVCIIFLMKFVMVRLQIISMIPTMP